MRYVVLLGIIAIFGSVKLRSGSSTGHVSVEQSHVWTPMRDGVKLAGNVFRPGEGRRLPTILLRTPYGKGLEITGQAQSFVDHGYNVMIQDVRGRGESDGVFAPLTQEAPDGDDTINWIAAQPWSNGEVGMTGGSYLGFAQWKVAVWNNPHLKAIFPVVSGDDDYRDRFYSPGGAMKWGHRLEWVEENLRAPEYEAPPFRSFIWTLPPRHSDQVVTGRPSGLLQAAFDHPAYDAFWKSISTRERLKACRVPVFSMGGWYDNYAEGDLDAFSTLRKLTGLNRTVIGPWPHNMSVPFTTMDFGGTGSLPVRRMQLQWFDQWMKGKDAPAESAPPLKIYVMGANQWRDENEWPLARAIPTKFYLSSGGHANSVSGDGQLTEFHERGKGQDHFIYDPKTPVQTLGGAVCCNVKVFPWGPMDQRPVEARPDVLVYTTEPLNEDLEATGPISLVLFAATSAPDTDFTGKLVDVYPDGRAINLTDGIIRARYRDGLDQPKVPVKSGAVSYTIDVGVTSNLFRKGHRIRLEISSSNFPRFDRNPNTGRAIADETRLVKASQTVFHDRGHRSFLLLPIIPPALPAVQSRLLHTRG